MYNAIVLENADGDKLNFGMGYPFEVVDIDGLYPPTATINTSQVALMDGAKYNSSKLNMRTINFAFAIVQDPQSNRIEVFKVLRSKQYIKMRYTGKYRDVYIEGYIESINISYFAIRQVVTVVIICPNPYFLEDQLTVNELASVVDMFHFPFPTEDDIVFGYFNNNIGISIENKGDVACGMIITLRALSNVSDPKIFNYISREFIGLDIDMIAEDVVTIDTRQGQKSATLLRSGIV